MSGHAANPGSRHEPGLNLRWIVALVLLPVTMLLVALFGFQEVYRLWCKASGTVLRPNDPAIAALAGEHTGRFIKVWFESTISDGLSVSFGPDESNQMVEVGMDGRNTYRIQNTSDQVVRIRPVHYLSPINASGSFGMKVCFCFNDQELQPHESRVFPIVYLFAKDLDPRIHTVTICYTLFKLSDGESSEALNRRIDRTIKDRGAVVSPRIAPTPYLPTAAPAPAAAPVVVPAPMPGHLAAPAPGREPSP